MTLFNADDYGITVAQAAKIRRCRTEGCLTGVSVMPNSLHLPVTMAALRDDPTLHVAVHLNLTEGLCLSDPADIPLLVSADGRFHPSFVRLLRLSLGPKRWALRSQIKRELFAQIARVAPLLEGRPLRLDGHQHIQMIPAVLQAVQDILEKNHLQAQYIRWSCEPLGPYLRHPRLWGDYSPVNVAKNLVLNFLSPFDRKYMRAMGLEQGMIMGLVISGNLEYRLVSALLPDFQRLAEKKGKTLELVMHPGWGIEPGEGLDAPGGPFEDFYLDPGRQREYDCLLQLKPET